jgi:hypothetical protein
MPRRPDFLGKVQLVANDETEDRMQFVQSDDGIWEVQVYDDAVIERVTTRYTTLQKMFTLYGFEQIGRRSWHHPRFTPHSNWKSIKRKRPATQGAVGSEPQGKPQKRRKLSAHKTENVQRKI